MLAAMTIGFILGNIFIEDASIEVTMMVWTITMVVYLFFSIVGLISEFQRSDILTLDKFMHLPVTPGGAFLINYIGSSVNLSVVVFSSAMLGITAGMLLSKGTDILAVVPLLLSFFLMITALIYQFRGWLASMMTNPRRRKSIVVGLTFVFVIIMVSPNLLIFKDQRNWSRDRQQTSDSVEVVSPDNRGQQPDDGGKQIIPERGPPRPDFNKVRLIIALAPPGWLPFGVISILEGRLISALACLLGMLLIAVFSLRRSYQTTVRMYQGYFNAGKKVQQQVVVAHDTKQTKKTGTVISRRIPWISEQAYAITAACVRAMFRAPEMKFMLLTPVIMLIISSGFFFRMEPVQSQYLQSLMAVGMAVFMLFMSMVHVLGNMFVFDKNGFRAYMMGPVSRRDILLGKNLAFVPFAFILMLSGILISNWFQPMLPDHLLAVVLQMIPMYLLFCITGNYLSIMLPIIVKPGTGMPIGGQGFKVLVQMLCTILMPVPLVLTLAPLGFEYLMEVLNWHTGFPAFLFLQLIQVAIFLYIYSIFLDLQADLLYQREQRVLEVVTAMGE